MAIGRRLAFSIYIWFALAVTASGAELLSYLPIWGVGVVVFILLSILLAFSFGTARTRTYVSQLNLRWITLFHLWRVLPGLAFLVLGWSEILPRSFAVQAGLGDTFIALTAPFVANRLELTQRKPLLLWHLLGLADLFLALGIGMYLALTGDLQMLLMIHFPLSLLPLFFVPLTMAMHAFALYILCLHRVKAP